MSKGELIEAIRRFNRTVSQEFLARFGEEDLKAYLERICNTAPPAPAARLRATVDAQAALNVA